MLLHRRRALRQSRRFLAVWKAPHVKIIAVPELAPKELYSRVEVLRLLGSGESTPLDGNIELLRSVLRISAEACERLDETDRRFSQALLRIADLEALLARVVEVLETAPLPVDGGSGHTDGESGAQQRLACNVGPCCALLHGATHHDILDRGALHAGA